MDNEERDKAALVMTGCGCGPIALLIIGSTLLVFVLFALAIFKS